MKYYGMLREAERLHEVKENLQECLQIEAYVYRFPEICRDCHGVKRICGNRSLCL